MQAFTGSIEIVPGGLAWTLEGEVIGAGGSILSPVFDLSRGLPSSDRIHRHLPIGHVWDIQISELQATAVSAPNLLVTSAPSLGGLALAHVETIVGIVAINGTAREFGPPGVTALGDVHQAVWPFWTFEILNTDGGNDIQIDCTIRFRAI